MFTSGPLPTWQVTYDGAFTDVEKLLMLGPQEPALGLSNTTQKPVTCT